MGNEKETEKNIINRTTQKGQLRSFFAGYGKKIMKGLKIVGGLAKYVVTPANWGKSGKYIIYDGKQVVNEILGNTLDKDGYVHPPKLNPHSKCSMEIKGKGGRSLVFKASEVFIGNIAEMSDAQINEVNALNDKNKNFDIVIDQEAKKIIIEIDVENIVSDIKANVDQITAEIKAKNKGRNEEEVERLIKEEIERLAIGKIIEQADAGLKGFAKISGGELRKYTDSQLLTDTGKELYQAYEKQEKSPAENPTKPSVPMLPNVKTLESFKDNRQQEEHMGESFFSMTVPRSRLSSYEKLISTSPGLQVKATNVEDVSNVSNPSSAPNANVKKGPGIS